MIDVQTTAFATLDRDRTRFGAYHARLRAEVAARYGAITDAEHEQWLAQLEATTADFLVGSVYVFGWGTRP